LGSGKIFLCFTQKLWYPIRGFPDKQEKEKENIIWYIKYKEDCHVDMESSLSKGYVSQK
jgi:hypothetical protein